MKLIITLSMFMLVNCYADEGQQQLAEPKSLATTIAENCTEKYEYLRFELEGEGENAKGKSIVMNFRVKESDLQDCRKMTKIEVCVEGECWPETPSECREQASSGQ